MGLVESQKSNPRSEKLVYTTSTIRQHMMNLSTLSRFAALAHTVSCQNIFPLVQSAATGNFTVGYHNGYAKNVATFVRTKEAREPRIPMTICDRTFQLVDEHLGALGYDGPVGLSCDDTKLFPSWRLYWDAKKKYLFLVGGIGEPMHVADPERLKEMINDAELVKATKVQLWYLQVPLPKVAPIFVAALPIPNDLDANQLLDYGKQILFGLLDRHRGQTCCSTTFC